MYIEYFNIMNNSSPGTPIFISISMVVLLALLLYLKTYKKFVLISRLLPLFAIIGSISLTLLHIKSGTEYRELQNVILENRHLVIEGLVENFTPGGTSGLTPESFTVNGTEFSYFEDSSTSAFHKTRGAGGPINEGLRVRIFYYQNSILGLWIGGN